MNDIVINKIQSIQRCIERARQEYRSDPDGFAVNHTLQDAAVLNVLRACEQAIDLANHVIHTYKMGIPTASTESFDLLLAKHVIDVALSEKLKQMVHFRNIVIHQYQRMDIEIVTSVIVSGLDDLVQFGDRVKEFIGER
ncbi:MAG: DUF86 domain-containing protein [Candidatus Methylomirabilis oxygeniifera]|uniref:Toxin-antitoxin antitoxin component n=1 Tax=Methylomirabilis oxygeniifera TaxID=671143 RepID=D5MHW0_METO1|nr:MAG: DUF86 domain-containing protein [Candidatus Methylomirabilis oxyfera]CBE69251.1 conserved protein of unknown function [Candidatus Methylomirabilis oxyfera]